MNETVSNICACVGKIIPADCMQLEFMQMALLGLIIITPMTAVCGVQVVNFRMAFFSDAIGHSAFTGVALGLLLALSPDITMPCVALVVGLCIMGVKQRSGLSTDTVIGVVFSAVVAAGLAVVSRYPQAARDMQMFLYGDILTITPRDIASMAVLLAVFIVFQLLSFNKLICIGLNRQLAKAHRINIPVYQYIFAALLALVVIFSVKAVGVLLVTALLITPAAAARNVASSYGGMLWYSIAFAMISSVAGLFISSLECVGTATGATIVICSCILFAVTLVFRRKTRE